ncbi:uncharacterized protein AC631_01597 [Debaryomyces fabryi]|uniref:Autophagy-related protein 25 n=1 Tax=Debaryomyces fabryi TaxID=58627 RepID=A0A0V1Q2D8_9ASCO|nr:uncharacterized protein AC631_01597 [Debaryomyces fabryi]KSA02610.1 hypothetical protein AC631_01597 [Debaryomyces fabryi]CUM45719.1 unnamed protein product [Debaryomyces fabryi]
MASDPPYLDTEAIFNASDLINSTLISKGYITEKLNFNSINWKDLVQDQIENNRDEEPTKLDELKVTEAIYNNDKNIINIIYSLLQSIERNKAQNKSFNKVISKKDSTIRDLQKKVESLEHQVEHSESRLNRFVQIDQLQLSKRVHDLTHINKLQSQDLNKLKNWCTDIKTKYHIELKKKNIEIDQLKNQLLEKKNLSTTTAFGIPLSIDSSRNNNTTSFDQDINSNVIYNHNPIIDNTNPNTHSNTSLLPILNEQYEQIVIDLTQLIENLISENHKFSRFIKLVNNYYQSLNIQLSNINHKHLDVHNLPNPSDLIDLNEFTGDSANISSKDSLDEIESFEYITKPLLNNVYKNYHYVSNLVELVDSNNSQINVNENGFSSKKIDELKTELEIVTRNWQDAIKTLENWKNYQHANDN